MKVEESQVYKCVLTLGENEAKILKGMMQNSGHYVPEDEPEDEKKLREAIFKAINIKNVGIR
jgi:hypothetical protein